MPVSNALHDFDFCGHALRTVHTVMRAVSYHVVRLIVQNGKSNRVNGGMNHRKSSAVSCLTVSLSVHLPSSRLFFRSSTEHDSLLSLNMMPTTIFTLVQAEARRCFLREL